MSTLLSDGLLTEAEQYAAFEQGRKTRALGAELVRLSRIGRMKLRGANCNRSETEPRHGKTVSPPRRESEDSHVFDGWREVPTTNTLMKRLLARD